MKSKRNFKRKKLSTGDLEQKVFRLFLRSPKKRFNASTLSKKLKGKNSKDAVQHVINRLEKEGKVFQVKEGKYRLDKFAAKEAKAKHPKKKYTGKVDLAKSGAAFIMVDSLERDIYVAEKNLAGAMHGDTVVVSAGIKDKRRRMEGKVKEITKRALKFVLGTFKETPKYGMVYSEMKKYPIEVHINPEDYNGANDGDKVLAEITSYGKAQNKSLWGNVNRLVAEMSDNDFIMNSILIESGFEIDFPAEVTAEADKIPMTIAEHELEGRRDFRGITTVTIDPDTAQDFDDALSYQVLENGNIEIGVHIADVTHYVRPETEIDKEALFRSTSVYLVDRVAPMLPEKLSNNLCSLVPHQDRLAFSAVFTFDKNDKVIDRWFGKTVIHSDRRFTYEEAQEILENKEGEFAHELVKMNSIAYSLRKAKFKNGAIAFESPEIKFKLDENAVPVSVYVKDRKDAHMMIEDFMLLANKEVAIFLDKKAEQEVPFVYRIHDEPDPDKLMDFKAFAREMGVELQIDTPQQISKSFNALSKQARENEELKILEPFAIRTMSKAAYSTENIGHYGLAFPHYAHFTSPIRRYADVLVHRILFDNLKKTKRWDKEALESMCKHISKKERDAMTAERDSIKVKQVEYMLDKVGQTFDGKISGIIDRGVFVEVTDGRAEGLIGFDKFNEVFEFFEGKLKVKGKSSGKILKMGQSIKVRVVDVDMSKRQIELELA